MYAAESSPPHDQITAPVTAPCGWARLCFTAEGHLDFSWLLVIALLLLGLHGSYVEFYGVRAPSPWWWGWLAGAQLSVLIAAVPIAKARILASSKALEAASQAIGVAAQQFKPHTWADGTEDGVL